MSDTLRQMNTTFKCLFTAYLLLVALGYGMAGMQILMTSGMADGKLGLSIKDVEYSYHGNPATSLLETKLNGSMQDKLPGAKKAQIIAWLHDGAEETVFNQGGIKAIFAEHCTVCHYTENSNGLPDFTVFANIKARSVVQATSITNLTRLSHIHLFSIAFIFFSVGFIFAFSSCLPLTFKNILLVLPFLFLAMDVSSWWLTRFDAHFSWLVIVSGTGLALTFVIMWAVSIYEMWFATADLKAERL